MWSSESQIVLYSICGIVMSVLLYEYWGRKIVENFSDKPNFFGQFFPRRYDIVPGQLKEPEGYIRDIRHIQQYVDVQKIGFKNDFCRFVMRQNDPDSLFLACALAGTEGLDSYKYRSPSVRSGFRISRDEYFRDVNADGRDDYCRILKTGINNWEAQCTPATDEKFDNRLILDSTPPPEIRDLLWFYEGIMVWYRFFDDQKDYAENSRIYSVGDVKIDEDPEKIKTTGMQLNRLPPGASDTAAIPSEQFIRLGENEAMELEEQVSLRKMRAIHCWVYFDEFTNNARIFDFGNGAAQDNVFLGIEGTGDSNRKQMEFNASRPTDSDRVCRTKPATEVSPQLFLKTSEANIDEWECLGPEPVDVPLEEKTFDASVGPDTATLVFEIWDARQRKMKLKVPGAFHRRKWHHVVLTTTGSESARPTWEVYIDKLMVYKEMDGHLAQSDRYKNNYIGRSNWESVDSLYDNKDARFSGCLFDFRLYKTPMTVAKIERSHLWGSQRLLKES